MKVFGLVGFNQNDDESTFDSAGFAGTRMGHRTSTLLALVSTMGMPYTVLMPAIARNALGGDSHTLGFLMTASGLGALGGALYLASRRTVVGLGRVIAMAAVIASGL